MAVSLNHYLKFDSCLSTLFDDFIETLFGTVRQLKSQFDGVREGKNEGDDQQQGVDQHDRLFFQAQTWDHF